MRISGFVSGMDIDAMVKEMMKAKRIPLDKLNQQKTTLEWQRDQYRDINTKLVDFRNNKLFNYGLESNLNAKQANITGNTSAVSAKALPGALSGTMTVDVSVVATAAYARTGATQTTTAIDGSQTLDALGFTPTAAGAVDASGNFNITMNGFNIVVNKNDTLRTAIGKINADTRVQSNVFLDEASGKMSVTKKLTGSAATVDVSDAFFSRFKLTDTAPGVDAKVAINGITTTQSNNTFTVNGVELTVNAKSLGSISTVNVGTDTNKILDTIKSFISDYNSLLDTINGKLNEERFRKYTPLTADQKTAMKDNEIALWEEKAKSGLLSRDSTLSKLVNDARLAGVTDVTINSKQVNMVSYGITTGPWQDRGKLVIQDEAKLRAAIEANPDEVLSYFTQPTKQTDASLKIQPTNPDNGLFNRLSDVMMAALNELSAKAGTNRYSTDKSIPFKVDSTMGELLKSLDRRIDDENSRMTMLETRYYKQFTAMETAMNRYQSQSSSLFGATQ
ncbi:flagellar cap protein FliD [Cohnella pontilimi]|uniref:Flagellar hook-associated protein 2 n=1 Tax=Cohnella pontilimi TaxID=2564100 RepID=A0A4U0FCJ7_9BACL|nr:flagellar filament capping protein FliD [Cohnella pontilimi]TJY41954.1 flagellar cap protein FliD [Cohnella pontilimi]